MLNVRELRPRRFQTRPGEYFYTFTDNLFMAPIGVWEEDWVPDSDDTEWVYPEQEIIHLLVKAFKQIPQVQSICAQFGPEITIWTLLESYDRNARQRIYQKELEICQSLRIYNFDFRASSVDLVSPDELIRSGSREIYRRP